jgi:hypothetical protein
MHGVVGQMLFEQQKIEAQITFENACLDRRKGELIEKLAPAQFIRKLAINLRRGTRGQHFRLCTVLFLVKVDT